MNGARRARARLASVGVDERARSIRKCFAGRKKIATLAGARFLFWRGLQAKNCVFFCSLCRRRFNFGGDSCWPLEFTVRAPIFNHLLCSVAMPCELARAESRRRRHQRISNSHRLAVFLLFTAVFCSYLALAARDDAVPLIDAAAEEEGRSFTDAPTRKCELFVRPKIEAAGRLILNNNFVCVAPHNNNKKICVCAPPLLSPCCCSLLASKIAAKKILANRRSSGRLNNQEGK